MFEKGQGWRTESRLISAKDIKDFIDLTGDTNDVHVKPITFDEKINKGNIIAHGLLVESIVFGLISNLNLYENKIKAMVSKDTNYLQYVFPGDSIYGVVHIVGYERRKLSISVEVFNQDSKKVMNIIYLLVLNK